MASKLDALTLPKRMVVASIAVAVAVAATLMVVLLPFLGVSDNLPANTKNLKVVVCNFDGPSSTVYSGLSSFLTAAAAQSTSPLPEYSIISGISSQQDLEDVVTRGEAWGAIGVAAGASARLMAAVLAAPNSSNPAYSSYDPASAMTYTWSEGRNPAVASRSSSPTRLLLTKFSTVFGQGLAQQVASGMGSAKVGQLALQAPYLLAAPVSFREKNLAVAFTMPTALLALTVGLVLIVVMAFASVRLAVRLLPNAEEKRVKQESGGTLIRADGMKGLQIPPSLMVARGIVMFCGSFGSSLMYAICVVGMAGDTYQGGAVGFFRLWAIALLTSCCYTWFLGGLQELSGDADIATLFIPVAYYSTLANYNLDTADEGYKVFEYNPVHWTAKLARNNFFGPAAYGTDADIGTSLGILFAWAIFGLAFYPFVAMWLKPLLLSRRSRVADLLPAAASAPLSQHKTVEVTVAVLSEGADVELAPTRPAAGNHHDDDAGATRAHDL